MSEGFKKLFSMNYIKKDIFNSIMEYCQMKIEYNDLENDIICTQSSEETLFDLTTPLTKDFFDTYFKNCQNIRLLIPFFDEKLRVIHKLKRYDRIIKNITDKDFLRKDDFFSKNHIYLEAYTVVYPHPIISNYDACFEYAITDIFIYNYVSKMFLSGVMLDEKYIPHFCLEIISMKRY